MNSINREPGAGDKDIRDIADFEQAVSRRNLTDFGEVWQQANGLVRQDVASGLYVVEDQEFGQGVFQLLADRYLAADENEKEAIISGMSTLGTRAQALQPKTIKFFLGLSESDPDTQLAVINGLRSKASFISSIQLAGEELTEQQENDLSQVVSKLINVAQDSQQKSRVRQAAIKDISQYCSKAENQAKVEETLWQLVDDSEPNLANQALDELIEFSQPGDQRLAEKALARLDKLTTKELDQGERVFYLRQLGKLLRPEQNQIIVDFPDNDDQVVKIEKDRALEQIKERG